MNVVVLLGLVDEDVAAKDSDVEFLLLDIDTLEPRPVGSEVETPKVEVVEVNCVTVDVVSKLELVEESDEDEDSAAKEAEDKDSEAEVAEEDTSVEDATNDDVLWVEVVVTSWTTVTIVVDDEDVNAALDAELELEEIVQLAPTVAPSKAYAMIAGSLTCLAGYNTMERRAITIDSSVVNTSTRSSPGGGVSMDTTWDQVIICLTGGDSLCANSRKIDSAGSSRSCREKYQYVGANDLSRIISLASISQCINRQCIS